MVIFFMSYFLYFVINMTSAILLLFTDKALLNNIYKVSIFA